MNDETEEELRKEHEQENSREMPGQRLREAREAAGLSQADVAAQLRINERMIRALEDDDYEVFPSATFVSGYLRSYSRLLGLNEEQVVVPVGGRVETPSIVTTIGGDEQVSSRALPVRLVTYLLVGVLLASVVMWIYSQRDTFLPPDETDAAQDGVNEFEPALPAFTPASPEFESAEEQTTEDVTATQSDMTDAPEADAAPGIDNADQATTDAVTGEVSEAPVAVSQLELRYLADSWTEITDSAGRELAYGLIKEGRTLTLTGEAPFRVFLGYAPGVEVYYNGELFEHAPFQRRDVARFRVGRAEHNTPAAR